MDEQALAEKLARMRPLLNERQWRHLLGAEAEAIGWGGIRVVARVGRVNPNWPRDALVNWPHLVGW